MATSFSPAQVQRLRREAKGLGRQLSISHSEALDRIAAREGFTNWSLLAKHSAAMPPRLAPKAAQAQVHATDQRRRHYLHGDVAEDDPSQCYCARCDLFVEPTHFTTNGIHQDGTDGERYLGSLARWERLPEEQKTERWRAANAPNVLAAQAIAARATYEASRSPFHKWLEGQRDRDDPVGDLAGDCLRDKAFPVAAETRREVEDHLSRHGDHVVRTLRQAWREFAASQATA